MKGDIENLLNPQPIAVPIDVDEPETLIFESFQTQFDFYRFLQQYIIHLIPHPFLLIAPIYPVTNFEALGFYSFDPLALYVNHVCSILFYIMVIAYMYLPIHPRGNQVYEGNLKYIHLPPYDQDNGSSKFYFFSDQGLVSGAMFVPLVFYGFHRYFVAAKYASLSPTEYDRFMSIKSYQVARSVNLNQLQLVSSWRSRNNELLLDYEIAAAMARADIFLGDITFKITDPRKSEFSKIQFLHWNAFLLCQSKLSDKILSKYLKPSPDGSYEVSVQSALKAILKNCSSYNGISSSINSVVQLLTLIGMFLPAIHYLDGHHPVHNYYVTLPFYATYAVIYWTFVPLVFSFLAVGIIDAYRRVDEASILEKMISCKGDLELRFKTDIQTCRELASRGRANSLIQRYRPKGKLFQISSSDPNPQDQKEVPLNPIHPSPIISNTCPPSSHDHSPYSPMFAIEEARIPLLSLGDFTSNNILAWTYARTLMRNYGARMKSRMDRVSGTACVFILFIMIIIIFELFTSWGMNSFPHISFCEQMTLIVVMVTFLLLILSWTGSTVNNAFHSHKTLLQNLVFEIEGEINELHCRKRRASAMLETTKSRPLADPSQTENKSLLSFLHPSSSSAALSHSSPQWLTRSQSSLNEDDVLDWQRRLEERHARKDLIRSCIQTIDTVDNSDPYTLFTLPANSSLTISIASTVLSFVTTLISTALTGKYNQPVQDDWS